MKVIALLVVLALTSASAQWPDFNQLDDQEDGSDEVDTNEPSYPWFKGPQQEQFMDQLAGRKPNPAQTSRSSTSTSSTIDSDSTRAAAAKIRACTYKCQTTSQYNPVCGTDGITYDNSQKLACAVRCGRRVSRAYIGKC